MSRRPSPPSLLTDLDLHLFNEGSHFRLWEKLGAHAAAGGTHFAVWAPDAERVSLIGDFNGWAPGRTPLKARGSSGIWEGFVEGVGPGALYKYHVRSRYNGYEAAKSDPFAFASEMPPRTASIVNDLAYAWRDDEWMRQRPERNALNAPVSVYEVHAGSWRRAPGNVPLNYRDLATQLASYVRDAGFTHVEFLPLMEHPFYGSWGYQTTGYFAPTARYGWPADLMHLIDHLHREGIGVILDWVPSHFPNDEHGLAYFDGTHLYEHSDPRRGFHPDWSSCIFNYGRNEVRSFLISSAMFWLERYHADGLRVDAVASMLYLDYSRREGEWIPNVHGGRENLEALSFLRRLNEEVYRAHPDVQMIAEESTAWPMVSRPTTMGGLGFGFKWDMGWMHDTLRYMTKDPIHRRHHHSDLTFRMLYAWTENFVLPLSHDEVVHGKGSLLGRMPGDRWQRFANLRVLLTALMTQPGKKLLFMGGEFGQENEWYHETSLDWHLLEQPEHAGVRRMTADLNRLYRREPSLHLGDCDAGGFEWIDCNDAEMSRIAFVRKGGGAMALVVLNFTPETRTDVRLGVPRGGRWRELFNSDAREYGGSGQGNAGSVTAERVGAHGREWSVRLTVPPLAGLVLLAE